LAKRLGVGTRQRALRKKLNGLLEAEGANVVGKGPRKRRFRAKKRPPDGLSSPRTHGDKEFGGEFGLLKGDVPLILPSWMFTTHSHIRASTALLTLRMRLPPLWLTREGSTSTPGFPTAFSRWNPHFRVFADRSKEREFPFSPNYA